MKNKCGICNRISIKDIILTIDKICKEAKIEGIYKSLLYIETVKIIENEDKEKCRSLWIGKKKNVIIGSIVYVVSHVFNIKQKPNKKLGYSNNVLSQRCIANALDISTPSIYNFYKKILKKHFVELSEAF